jgi:hypothetical protein
MLLAVGDHLLVALPVEIQLRARQRPLEGGQRLVGEVVLRQMSW